MFHERPLLACLFFSILALVAALVAEFGFGIAPCILCLAQRVPHALVIILASFVLATKKLQRPVLFVLVIVYLAGAGVGAYQVGVEQKWWGVVGEEQACTMSESTAVSDIETMYENMSGTAMGDCAHPEISFHGITFAGLNMLLCLCLMGLALYGARNGDRKEETEI